MQTIDFARLIKDRLQAIVSDDLPVLHDEAIFGALASRQLRRREERKGLSISSLGSCARQIGYKMMDEPQNGRTIDARALMTFAVGDFIEALLTTVLAEVLPSIGWSLKDYGEAQGRVELKLYEGRGDGENSNTDYFIIPGHRDGVLVSPEGDEAVLEVKSMASYSFTLFERNKGWPPSESYYWQHQGYLIASNLDHGYALAACKDSGAIAGHWTRRDEHSLEFIRQHLAQAEIGERRLPDMRPLGLPDEKGRLSWHCSYCSYHGVCMPEAKKTVIRDYRGRPSTALFVPLKLVGEPS